MERRKTEMKFKAKKIIGLILSLLLIISIFTVLPFTAGAVDTDTSAISGDFEYQILDDGTAEITAYKGNATELEIPNAIDGHTVTSIGTRPFGAVSTNLTSVSIPNTVTSIGDKAFAFCFNLIDITIPDSVTKIGEDAFQNCVSLKNIEISNNITSISLGMFVNCESLTNITIPYGVTNIKSFAFQGCINLEKVTISNTVTTIGVEAFRDCTNLKCITIPSSVTEIGTYSLGYFIDWNNLGKEAPLSDFTIYGYVNSSAEKYANENGFTFIELKDVPTTESTTITEPATTPSESTAPTESVTSTEPYESSSSTVPSESTIETEPTTSEQTESSELTNPTDNSSTTESTESTTVTEPATTESTESTTVTEPTTSEQTESSELTIPTDNSSTTEFTESTTVTEPATTNPTENTTATEPSETTPKPAKTTVTLKKSSATVYVKGTVQIKATVKNGKGKTTYKTSNKKVAKVNSSGKVTGIKKGTATITVTNNGVSKKFKITVKNPKLNSKNKILKKGKSFKLSIKGKVGKAKFTSSNKKVATVSKKGNIKAKKKGKTTIIVMTNGIKLKCKVTVK